MYEITIRRVLNVWVPYAIFVTRPQNGWWNRYILYMWLDAYLFAYEILLEL